MSDDWHERIMFVVAERERRLRKLRRSAVEMIRLGYEPSTTMLNDIREAFARVGTLRVLVRQAEELDREEDW